MRAKGPRTRAAILARQPATVTRSVRNTNRNLGTRLSGFIADHFGNTKGESNFIHLQLSGSAGQSLGTFLVQGVRITLTGEANDYVGKGMSGGEIVIRPPALRHFVAEDNSILGNTVMYGSTGGRLFASGRAGERFCVRNSGGTAVVEGVGDHGCEYMTNGTVVILGETGKNFGAGMSGGTAYIYDPQGQFPKLLNAGMVTHSPIEDPLEAEKLRTLIEEHRDLTGSGRAAALFILWAGVIDRANEYSCARCCDRPGIGWIPPDVRRRAEIRRVQQAAEAPVARYPPGH